MKGIIDASFLLTLLPGDPDAGSLRRAYPAIRERLDLVAPDLLALETANLIHGPRRARFGPSLGQRRRLHETLLEGIRLVPIDRPSLDEAAGWAERHSLTIYDSTYLTLAARSEDALLLSNDRRLADAARSVLGPGRAFDVPAAVRRFGKAPLS